MDRHEIIVCAANKYGDLIRVVEELGDEADGMYADLSIAEIPDGAEFKIDEYDGSESVEPPRQSW